MPSPYAHVIAGGILAMPFLKNKTTMRQHREDIATLMGFSLAADLDVLPALLMQDIQAYHNQISHSILFGIGASLAYAGLRYLLPNPKPFGRIFSLGAIAYGLHILMDAFTHGRGVMLFWPISQTRFQPPFVIFYGLRHSEGWFSYHHLITLATESITMLPLLALGWLIVKKADTTYSKKHG